MTEQHAMPWAVQPTPTDAGKWAIRRGFAVIGHTYARTDAQHIVRLHNESLPRTVAACECVCHTIQLSRLDRMQARVDALTASVLILCREAGLTTAQIEEAIRRYE